MAATCLETLQLLLRIQILSTLLTDCPPILPVQSTILPLHSIIQSLFKEYDSLHDKLHFFLKTNNTKKYEKTIGTL